MFSEASGIPRGADIDDFLQIITPAGERLESPDLDPWIADVGADQLRSLYQDLVAVRRIDSEATALARQGELGLWPPLLGQEAAQVASARALRDDDFAFTSYRENAVAWCRGVGLADIVVAWRGSAPSGWNPYDVGMATPAIIIGAQSLHAVGYAMGCALDESNSVAVAYFGDGATSEGDVSEAMVFAASFHLPVVFFCQNNQWAISEPVGLQSVTHLADRAPGFGIPSMRVDGNDVLAVMAVTRIALDRARSGGGPTFIEAVTYRVGPHTTADDPTRYRESAELEAWKAKDPIVRLQRLLEGEGVFTPEFEAETAQKANTLAAELRAGCINLPEPQPLELFEHVYAGPHRGLDTARATYAEYLDSFDLGKASS